MLINSFLVIIDHKKQRAGTVSTNNIGGGHRRKINSEMGFINHTLAATKTNTDSFLLMEEIKENKMKSSKGNF